MISLAAAIAVTASLGAAPPAQLRNWPSSQGFEVVQLESSCAISTSYDFDGRSPVELTLFYEDDKVSVLLTSSDWSNRTGEIYEVSYQLGGYSYAGEATGLVTSGRPGFVAKFEPTFLTDFAAASALLVTRGEVIITHLSLSGSGAAVATVRRCLEHVQRTNAAQARREQRWDYIPEDPFAPPAPAPASPAPSVVTNPSWARAPVPTMPQAALDLGLNTGTVRLNCRMEPNGSLTDCFIETESPLGAGLGEAALEAARRARISSATVDSAAPGARTAFNLRFRPNDSQP